ncbi:sirohydrochlorin chelatase [Flexibacterium corallicola]|uniref:sirohydrochlorin chelatase n=1 Tax=Flexibacterium corallicola TaxID=3037259 RepID=UPI00286F615C|nr:CbiX/SirB N-terminal domain-containing protein [Pseudovibrio sp. M1P-2-3]
MSGTKSPFQKVPATEVLIVSHGQPSDPLAGELYLNNLAQKVLRLLPDWNVCSVTLAAPGRLEHVLEKMRTPPMVFPFFMSDGWFVRKALPKRLGERRLQILAPLGNLSDLPARTAKYLAQQMENQRWSVEDTHVLLAAHGSASGPIPARCTREFADLLSQHLAFKGISVGFLEQGPCLHESARHTGPQSVLLPFFAGDGEHVVSDVPQALERAGYKGLCLPALGQLDFVPELIAEHLLRVASCKAAA